MARPSPATCRPPGVTGGVGLEVLGGIVVVLAAVTVGVSLGGSPSSTSRPMTSPSGSASGTTSTVPATSSTSSAPPAGAPTISAITPSVGTPGPSVAVAGTNLISPGGHVAVRFGDQVAPTSCPTSTACTATVPPSSAGGRVLVTVTTQAGTSSGPWFAFG